MQDNLPYCNEEGKWFVDKEGKIVEAATGNGDFWSAFYDNPLMNKYISLGIEHVFIMSVDNPLVLAFDENMIGFHCHTKADITASAVLKKDPLEKIGVFAQKEGKIYILEYIFAESQRFPYGNVGDYYASLSFIQRLHKKHRLPLHKVKKNIECVLQGKKQRKEAWKWERFIFDVFPYASVGVFPIDRTKGFAPLKSSDGPHGIAEVQETIWKRDQNLFFSLTGKKLPENKRYELSQEFYYPTPSLIERWKKKTVELEYIE
jgi:UDP-N-acetylglucosamine/UDP-N-acetylgalactosamine diphosphorylase